MHVRCAQIALWQPNVAMEEGIGLSCVSRGDWGVIGVGLQHDWIRSSCQISVVQLSVADSDR